MSKLVRAAAVAIFAVAVLIAGIPGSSLDPAMAAVNNSFLVSAADPFHSVTQEGETFFTGDVTLDTGSGNVFLAGSSDGTQPFSVDDILDIEITQPDGTVVPYVQDFSGGCSGNYPSAPVNLSAFLGVGVNKLHIIFRDGCGSLEGNTDVYLTGDAAFAGQQQTSTVTTPDFKIVRYIHSLSIPSCAVSVDTASLFARPGSNKAAAAAAAACSALQLTHNAVPGPGIAASAASWSKFVKSKQYRTLVDLPSATLNCSNGQVANLSWAAGAYRNFGYTPLLGGLAYVAGQPYLDDDGKWHDTPPDVTHAADNSSVSIDFRAAAAASLGESYGTLILGHVLPFVWVSMHEEISCDGTTGIEIDYSNTPTTVIYRDGTEIFSQLQTGDWGSFIASGGTKNVRAGHGNLDPHCSTVSFVPANADFSQQSNCGGPVM
jgi:hypothetical protein